MKLPIPLLLSFIVFLSLPSPRVISQPFPIEKGKEIKQIELEYSSNLKLQFVRRFPVKFKITLKSTEGGNTETEKIKGLSWARKNLIVDIENGTYKEGYVGFNPQEARQSKEGLQVKIQLKNDPKRVFQSLLPIPYLVDLSLQRDTTLEITLGSPVKIYLNRQYSDGLVRPLHSKWKSFQQSVTEYNLRLSDFDLDSNHEIHTHGGYFSIIPTAETPAFISMAVQYKRDLLLRDSLEVPVSYNSSHSFSFQPYYHAMDAPPINIFVKKIVQNEIDLLWIKSESPQHTFTTLINPAIAEVYIDCRGKDGSDGWDGTDGSDGGTDPPTDGYSGCDGSDGDNGGNGAEVFIYTDVASEPFLDALIIDKEGGVGGAGGQGGRGGRGGPGKCDGSDGSDGWDGSDGEDGPPVEIYYLPSNSLQVMIKKVGS